MLLWFAGFVRPVVPNSLFSEKLKIELFVHEFRFEYAFLPFLALLAEYRLFDLSDAMETALFEF